MALSDATKAGVALFVGVAQFGIFVIVAESVFPGYSVANNYISDLGPPCQGAAACGSQTSWWIFDSSIAIMGMCILVGGYFINRYFHWKPATGFIILSGIGTIGIGIFNENSPFMLHDIFSLITFVGIGLTAVVSFWLQKPPMSYFSVLLGLASLTALILYIPQTGTAFGSALGIGPGGLERMIVYPVIFWGLAFAGHLMGLEERPIPKMPK